MSFSRPHYAMIEKAKAMYGNRISTQEYQEMFRCKTVPEVASYLKNNTAYQGALQGVSEHSLHRGQLEQILHRNGFDRYIRLYYYLPDVKNTLFRFVLISKEITIILNMILLLKAGNHKDLLSTIPGYLIKHASIDLVSVATAQDFSQLIRNLEHSDYGIVLKHFEPSSSSQALDYVGCEYALYQYYYKRLFKMISQSYSGPESRQLTEFFHLQTELLNIEHVVRAHHLKILHQDVVRSLFPYHYKLPQQQLLEMIEAEHFDQIKQLLKQSRYGDIFFTNPQQHAIESYTKPYFYRYCSKSLQFSRFAPVVFFSYYNLNQIELNNITTVIEGIRYQLSPDQIQQLLILE